MSNWNERGGRGNHPWTPEELVARERLVELVAERPGLSSKALWQVWPTRPKEWEVWDVTSVLLDLSLTRPARIQQSASDSGWRFWAVGGAERGVEAPKKVGLAPDSLPPAKRRITPLSTPSASVRRKRS